MKIWIDGDGCPVVRQTVSLAKQYGIPCVILCDTSHSFRTEDAEVLICDKGADSVDYRLANLVRAGDLVVTQDYGLAAMCLSRRAIPVHQDGFVYTDENIGGLLEVRKIAAMAEAYDVAVAPHCPLGPIALAACLQLDATTPNAFIQEQSLGIHYNQGSDLLDYLADPKVFDYQDGFVSLPTAPGLGIEINEEKVAEMAAKGHRWRNPIWRNEDGTVAEW